MSNDLWMTSKEKEDFLHATGKRAPATVGEYNAIIDATREAWSRIGEQENCAEAKFLAAILESDKFS